MLIIKTKVEKQGDLSSYIQKSVISKIHGKMEGFDGDTSLGFKEVAIGVITEAVELEDSYELTMHIWDRFVKQLFSFQDNQLDAMYLSIEKPNK